MNKQSEFSRKSIQAAVGCWVGFLLGPNVMIAATNSNFMDALGKDFGSLSSISAAFAIAPLTVAILVPIIGVLMDRHGPRRVIIPGIIVFGTSFFLISRFQEIWQLAALQILLSVGAALNSSVGYAKVISSWFDQHRGFVLGGCVAFGAGVGQISMPKISQWLIESYGWRGGYMGISMIILAVGLPLVALLVRPSDRIVTARDTDKRDKAAHVPGLAVKEALRTASFYKVFFAIMFGSMSLLGTLNHARTLLEQHGFTADVATTAMSLSFAGVLLGETSSGYLVDRYTTPRIILPYFVCAWIGLMLFLTTVGSVPLLFLAALMMGMGLGGEIGQNAYMVSRYFGLKSFGSLYGFTFAASNVGIAIGLFTMGKMHDVTGSYDIMAYILGVTMAISVLCIASLGPFVYRADRAH